MKRRGGRLWEQADNTFFFLVIYALYEYNGSMLRVLGDVMGKWLLALPGICGSFCVRLYHAGHHWVYCLLFKNQWRQPERGKI